MLSICPTREEMHLGIDNQCGYCPQQDADAADVDAVDAAATDAAVAADAIVNTADDIQSRWRRDSKLKNKHFCLVFCSFSIINRSNFCQL